MAIVRDVFRAKYGRGGALVDLLKEAKAKMPQHPMRIFSDASGSFDTIVTETEVRDLADWERLREQEFSMPDFAEWFERMVPLVESGQREFYNVEGQRPERHSQCRAIPMGRQMSRKTAGLPI